MELKEFGNKICIDLKKVLGEDCETTFREVVKNNGVCLHSIVVATKKSNVSPAIYIDGLYEDYKGGRAFGDIVYDILCIYKEYAQKQDIDMCFFTQFAQAKSRILYKLIHRESNRELLKEVPHIKWNDLAIVFYYALDDSRLGRATILIRNSHLRMWEISLETLYECAKANMTDLRPEKMMSIGIMYILTNKEQIFGAASLLYSESMKRLTRKLDQNLIILPSSVHEVILVPDDGANDKEFFKGMVKEVNDTQVDPEERLSYNIYYYDRFSENITIM